MGVYIVVYELSQGYLVVAEHLYEVHHHELPEDTALLLGEYLLGEGGGLVGVGLQDARQDSHYFGRGQFLRDGHTQDEVRDVDHQAALLHCEGVFLGQLHHT